MHTNTIIPMSLNKTCFLFYRCDVLQYTGLYVVCNKLPHLSYFLIGCQTFSNELHCVLIATVLKNGDHQYLFFQQINGLTPCLISLYRWITFLLKMILFIIVPRQYSPFFLVWFVNNCDNWHSDLFVYCFNIFYSCNVTHPGTAYSFQVAVH